MNFRMLSHMVENLIQAYRCPHCGAKEIRAENIDIIGAAGNTVNIDMQCPNCKKHFIAKTEVIQMSTSNLNPEFLKKLGSSLQTIHNKLGGNLDISADIIASSDILQDEDTKQIKDESIVELQKDLKSKKRISVSDLFTQGETGS